MVLVCDWSNQLVALKLQVKQKGAQNIKIKMPAYHMFLEQELESDTASSCAHLVVCTFRSKRGCHCQGVMCTNASNSLER